MGDFPIIYIIDNKLKSSDDYIESFEMKKLYINDDNNKNNSKMNHNNLDFDKISYDINYEKCNNCNVLKSKKNFIKIMCILCNQKVLCIDCNNSCYLCKSNYIMSKNNKFEFKLCKDCINKKNKKICNICKNKYKNKLCECCNKGLMIEYNSILCKCCNELYYLCENCISYSNIQLCDNCISKKCELKSL